MDCDSRSLFIHDKEVYLTAKEFDLLELLVLNPNKVYSRETLLNTIWGCLLYTSVPSGYSATLPSA